MTACPHLEPALCAICAARPATVTDVLDGRLIRVCVSCVEDEVPDPPRAPTLPDRVVRAVRLSPGATVEDLALLLDDSDLGYDRVKKALHRAALAGVIRAVGDGHERFYHPATRGPRRGLKRS